MYYLRQEVTLVLPIPAYATMTVRKTVFPLKNKMTIAVQAGEWILGITRATVEEEEDVVVLTGVPSGRERTVASPRIERICSS